MAELFRLVKYYNLVRHMVHPLHTVLNYVDDLNC